MDDLISAMREEMKRHVPLQTFWARCESIEGDFMTASDIDEPEVKYYSVILGMGGIVQFPALGARVLVARVENKQGYYLIGASEVDSIRFRNGAKGAAVNTPYLLERLRQLELKHNSLVAKLELLPIPVVASVSDPPIPGSYTPQKIDGYTEKSKLENDRIKHG